MKKKSLLFGVFLVVVSSVCAQVYTTGQKDIFGNTTTTVKEKNGNKTGTIKDQWLLRFDLCHCFRSVSASDFGSTCATFG